MSVYNLPDYCTKYFKHKDLEKIHGQPNIVNICKLFKQGKRNAQTIPTILREGQLGHLVLYIKTVSYNAIPNSVQIVCPTDPGVLSLTYQSVPSTRAGGPVPLTPTDIETQKIAHGK